MASSENQGLQITVIILLISVLPLAGITWYFFSQSNGYYAQIKADTEKMRESETNLRRAVDAADKYKQMIGLSDEDDPEKASAKFTGDMETYGATLPAEKKFYRQALEEMATTLAKTVAENAATQAKINEMEMENAKARNEAKVAVDEAAKAKDAAVAELEAEKTKFMAAEKKAADEKKDVLDQLAQAQNNYTTELDKQTKAVADLTKRIATAEITIKEKDKVLQRLKGESPMERDDGEIRTVQERSNTVMINLGSSDGLRSQTVFFVHSPSVAPSDVAGRKGKVEVTQVMGPHLAEARIVDSIATQPILPGDRIYTSLWDPGRLEHFALVGRINLDDDGIDDRDRLRNIIRLSGGVIDAEIDDTGKLTGAISIDTRYLVEGQVSPKAQAAVDKMRAEAALLGVERIGADRVLDYIGVNGPQQTVRYGPSGNVSTVTRAVPDGGLPQGPRQAIDSSFRKRQPPPAAATAPTFQ